MATRPPFEEPQAKPPGPRQPESTEAAKRQLLTSKELQAVLQFFSLLDEWDQKRKII